METHLSRFAPPLEDSFDPYTVGWEPIHDQILKNEIFVVLNLQHIQVYVLNTIYQKKNHI